MKDRNESARAMAAPGFAATPIGRLFVSPYSAGVLAMLFWAGSFAMVRGVALTVPPVGLSFWRAAVAAAIFVVWAWPYLAREIPDLRRRTWGLVWLGLIQTFGNTASMIAMHSTTVINAGFINAMISVEIVVFAWLIYRETATRLQVVGIAISLAGVLALVARGDPAVLFGLDFNRGDLWIFLAVLCWALYAATVRRLTAGLNPRSALAAMSVYGAIGTLPMYLWEHFVAGWRIELDAAFYTSLFYVALFPSVFAIALWTRTLRIMGAQRASVMEHLIPVFSVLFGVILLGERLELYHGLGAALIAAGIYLTAVLRSKGAAGH